MITFDGYTLDGFKLTFSLPADTIEEALYHVRAAKNAGVTPEPQDPDAQQTETIATVVRREHEKNGKITPVVDFYPAWKGEYGQFKFCHVYLNTEEDIAQFEAQSGLKLANMPLYEAQGPLQRKPGSAKRVEVTCKPFIAHKIAGEEKTGDDGKPMRPWKFAGYGAAPSASSSTPAPQPESPQKSAQAEHWSSDSSLVKAMNKWTNDTFNMKSDQIENAIKNTGRALQAMTRDEVKGAVLAYAAQYNADKMGTIGEDKGLSAEVISAAMSITLTEFPA